MTWRRGSESNGVFTDCQPQYPDLQGHFNIDSKGLQEIFGTTRHLPDLTRHIPAAYTVIEEIVEGFVEGFYCMKTISMCEGTVELCLVISCSDVGKLPIAICSGNVCRKSLPDNGRQKIGGI